MSIPSNSIATTVNPVTPDQLNTYVQMCDTVSDLKNFIGVENQTIELLGTSSPGDGGQGVFYWNSTGTSPDDNGVTTIIPSGSSVGNGEWTRIPNVISGIQNLTNAINFANGGNIPSAATTPIGAASGNNVTITGTTTITAFDTVQAGTWREVTFSSILTLTYNAMSFILPTAANITTAAGDTAIFLSLGGGNWRCVVYQRFSGQALISAGFVVNVQTITSNGTYTPTTGMQYCIVRMLGGGGGGGGLSSVVVYSTAGPGGAGSYSEGLFLAATIGSSQVATIGAAGIAGTTAGTNGGNGGNTSLGSLLTANGGSGGGGLASGTADNGSPGAGGTPGTGGYLNVAGAISNFGFSVNTTATQSSPGASSQLGAGGIPISVNAGQPASGYGSGGSGASVASSGTGQPGGVGTAGVIIITEFCT